MKTLLPFAIAIFCGGCMGTGSMTRLVTALAKDPATATIRVTTIYGTFSATRTNPGTNTAPHQVSPDGTVTIGGRP